MTDYSGHADQESLKSLEGQHNQKVRKIRKATNKFHPVQSLKSQALMHPRNS